MSLVPAYTDKAQVALAGLDPLLQEDLLDEVERLLTNPGVLRTRRSGPAIVHDLVVNRAGFRHYLFLTLEIDHIGGVLLVDNIGHAVRPLV